MKSDSQAYGAVGSGWCCSLWL